MTRRLRRSGNEIREKAAAYRLKIDIQVLKSENLQAVDSALECLRLFGTEMPARPTLEEVQAEYEKIWVNLGERSIESLVDLPCMTDPGIQAAMRVSFSLRPISRTSTSAICTFVTWST